MMKDSLRYKAVLWMVCAQIALLPVVIVMINVTNNGVMWRWNLPNWLMTGGYVLGLLALPVSRGLDKPKWLKWWLRADFWLSLIPAVIALPVLYYGGRHYIDAEDGEYVLYHTTGFVFASPGYKIGKKEGVFVRKLPQWIRVYDYGDKTIECFKVDPQKGCLYGLKRGPSPAVWVLPVDSARYHRHTADIKALIDSLYQVQPLLSRQSYGTFVYPDNFAEINYEGRGISYADSISYYIDISEGDSLRVTVYDDKFPHLSFPKDSAGSLSPQDVRKLINRLKDGSDGKGR